MRRPHVLCLLLLPLAAALVAAGPIGSKTFVDDHVMLRLFSGVDDPPCGFGGFFRVFPDGSSAAQPFVVPNRRVLVVTDYVWGVRHIPPFAAPTPGLSLVASLYTYSAPATSESRLYQSEVVDLTAENVDGQPGAHSRIAGGALARSGRLRLPTSPPPGMARRERYHRPVGGAASPAYDPGIQGAP